MNLSSCSTKEHSKIFLQISIAFVCFLEALFIAEGSTLDERDPRRTLQTIHKPEYNTFNYLVIRSQRPTVYQLKTYHAV